MKQGNFKILVDASGDSWHVVHSENIEPDNALIVSDALDKAIGFHEVSGGTYLGENIIIYGNYNESTVSVIRRALYSRTDCYNIYGKDMVDKYSDKEIDNIIAVLEEMVYTIPGEIKTKNKSIYLRNTGLINTWNNNDNDTLDDTVSVYFDIMNWYSYIEIEVYTEEEAEEERDEVDLGKTINDLINQ